MPHSRHRSESEKGDVITLESLEAQDVITPLSPIRSCHRHTSIGNLPTSPHSPNSFTTLTSCLVHDDEDDDSIHAPPSFAESQFATIIRRQRAHDSALKVSNVPTRYPNLPRDFEFAGYDP